MTDKEFDAGLEAIMGDRFHDETKPTEKPVEKPVAKPTPKKKTNPAKKVPAKDIPVECQWQPEKPEPDFMDKLKSVVKSVCLYAVMSLVLFWWKQTGLLEEQTAWYALLVCVGMVFFSVGRICRGGGK